MPLAQEHRRASINTPLGENILVINVLDGVHELSRPFTRMPNAVLKCFAHRAWRVENSRRRASATDLRNLAKFRVVGRL